ncbi:hypothetical protein BC833DRAFT_585392 [Globomyces pollinis-pini]|nr:hypothetical protein BC833DRAFT_585392 [Globomyces pollinis-pini]
MAFIDELKAGKACIYGQWSGWLSSLLLIIFGFSTLFKLPIFGAIALGEGVFLILLEVSFLAKCIRGTDRIIAVSSNLKIKAAIYTIFAASLWCSLIQAVDTILIPAISLTAGMFFYIIAVARGEESVKSNVVTSEGIARTVINSRV